MRSRETVVAHEIIICCNYGVRARREHRRQVFLVGQSTNDGVEHGANVKLLAK